MVRFKHVLENSIKMNLIWAIGLFIGLIGLSLLWIGFKNFNWFLLILGLIVIGASVLIIAWGTGRFNLELDPLSHKNVRHVYIHKNRK